jgi:predicted metal-dependent phosphoesterase TrpH
MNPIQLKKPRLDYLHQYFIADMHFHTKYSDGRSTIEQLVRALRKKDIAVAITDHNQIKGVLEASKYKDVSIIPGIEVTSCEGAHILFYFYSKKELEQFYNKMVKKNIVIGARLRTSRNAEELLDASKNFNCISSIAHPFSRPIFGGLRKLMEKKALKKSIVRKYNAMEVISGQCTSSMNKKAILWNSELRKPFTAGSDGHILMELGDAVSYADAQDFDEFLDAVRKKRNFAVGKGSRFVKKMLSDVELVEKYLRSPNRPKYRRILIDKIEDELHMRKKAK